MDYTPTKWNTAEDKVKFEKQFKKFVSGGYQLKDFPRWFYKRLSMCFGFIAHYDQHGFYWTYFDPDDSGGIDEFESQVINYPYYGDPACTYSDVEKVLREWITQE